MLTKKKQIILRKLLAMYLTVNLTQTIKPLRCMQLKTLTKKFVQTLHKIYTTILQSTKFVYILYTKILQIKILYDNECTRNVHQIPTYIQKLYKLHKICTKFRINTAWNLNCMFFCTDKQCTNYTKSIELTNWNGQCMFLYIHTIYKLYKMYKTC